MPRFGVCLLALVCSGPVGAQTAAMARAASVAFHSQRSTLPLTGSQQREADRLDLQAQEQIHKGRYGEALRCYAHAAAALRNVVWDNATEFAASLQGRLDHVMLDPGRPVTLALTALYSSTGTSAVSVFLVSTAKDGPPERELLHSTPVESARLPFATRVNIPEVHPGTYNLELRMAAPDEGEAAALRDLYVKTFPVRIERLAEEARHLRERLAGTRPESPAMATAEYLLQFYDRTDHGEEGVRRFGSYPFHEQFRAAEAALDALDAGREPWTGQRGDLRRAYRSTVDGTLQPYRIFVPSSYDGTRPVPLLVALHGAGGDENDFFDDFPQAPLTAEVERHGFLLVCPKGREPRSGYRGNAERDVFDVLAEVRRDYRIDDARIYLMGHSMGAYATWRLAAEHPDLFAALGPISGGGDPQEMLKIRHIPEYIVHGANDQTVPVAQSRAMAEAARAAHVDMVYVEVAGAGHYDAAIGQFGPMLDFFARQAKH